MKQIVLSVADGKSPGVTVVTLACGHRQVWETRTVLPKVGAPLWCSGCYSHGDTSAKALRSNAKVALNPEGRPSA